MCMATTWILPPISVSFLIWKHPLSNHKARKVVAAQEEKSPMSMSGKWNLLIIQYNVRSLHEKVHLYHSLGVFLLWRWIKFPIDKGFDPLEMEVPDFKTKNDPLCCCIYLYISKIMCVCIYIYIYTLVCVCHVNVYWTRR